MMRPSSLQHRPAWDMVHPSVPCSLAGFAAFSFTHHAALSYHTNRLGLTVHVFKWSLCETPIMVL